MKDVGDRLLTQRSHPVKAAVALASRWSLSSGLVALDSNEVHEAFDDRESKGTILMAPVFQLMKIRNREGLMANDQQPPERKRGTDAAALAESAKHMESSAGAVKKSAHELTDSADRRTELAADRTLLAAERTYAAWVRTGLASLASGVGAQALLGDVLTAWLVAATGSVLISFSAFCFVAGVWRQFRVSDAPPVPDTTRIPPLLFILVNGFLVIVSLAALVGIWSGVIGKH